MKTIIAPVMASVCAPVNPERASSTDTGVDPITFEDEELGDATLGVFYSESITIFGGVPPYHYNDSSGIPSGMTVDIVEEGPNQVIYISGTPDTIDTYPFFVVVRDSLDTPGTYEETIVVNPATISRLYFEGANASTTITDEDGHTWTAHGAAALSTSSPLVGTSSLLLTGGYVDSEDHADFGFANDDWAMQFTLFSSDENGGSGSGNQCVIDTRRADREGIAFYAHLASRNGGWGAFNNSGVIVQGGVGVKPSAGQAATFTIARVGGVLDVWVDGVSQGGVGDVRTYASAATVTLGDNYVHSQSYPGKVDAFTIWRGASVPFTPGVSF